MTQPVRPVYRHVLTVAVWAGVLCSIYGWSVGLRPANEPADPKQWQSAFSLPANSTDAISQLLGNPAAVVQMSAGGLQTRFLLAGVIADDSGTGAALISVDGKAPRPYPVGAELAPGVVLHGVMRNQALLSESPDSAVSAVLNLVNVKTAGRDSLQNVGSPAVGQTTPQVAAAISQVTPTQNPQDPPPRLDSRYRMTALPHH